MGKQCDRFYSLPMRFDVICLTMEGSKTITAGVHSARFGYIGKITHSCSHSSITVLQATSKLGPRKPSDTTAEQRNLGCCAQPELIRDTYTRPMKKMKPIGTATQSLKPLMMASSPSKCSMPHSSPRRSFLGFSLTKFLWDLGLIKSLG